MKLVFATPEFQLNGVGYPGFPLLLDSAMEQVEPAHRYLIYHLIKRGRVGSKQSWKTLGQHLYDYFGFLEAYELRWDEVARAEDHSVVSAYRDYAVDQCGLKPRTVNQRLRTVVAFYRYAVRRQWLDALPFEMEEVYVKRDTGFLAHLDASGSRALSPDVLLRESKEPVEFLTREQVRRLVQAISNSTHKLMVRVGLQTGMRREEIATFPVKRVFNPDAVRHKGAKVRVELNPSEMAIKGAKKRYVDLPRALMEDLWQYVIHERNRLAKSADTSHSELFLSQDGLPWASNGAGFRDILARHGKRLGFRVSPHLLRHTYATHTLFGLHRLKAGLDPLVYLKGQLGHASIASTLIYAHLVKQIASEAVLDYDLEVTEWSR